MALIPTLTLTLLVLAAPEPEGARALYQAGTEAYDQGRYDVAIGAFEEVLRLEARPVAMFAAAQAHRLQFFANDEQSHLERAVELYRAYLEAAPNGARRDHATQHLATLVPILDRRRGAIDGLGESAPVVATRLIVSSKTPGASARLDGGEPVPIPATFEVSPGPHAVSVEAPEHVTEAVETVAVEGGVVAVNLTLAPTPGELAISAPEGARVEVDGRRIGQAPLGGPLRLAPGLHRVAIGSNGREPFLRNVQLPRGGEVTVDAELVPTARRQVAYALFVTGGGLLAGAATTLAFALDRESQAQPLEARLDAAGLSPSEARQYQSLGRERGHFAVATVALGAAAAVAVGSAVLLWVSDEPDLGGVVPVIGPSGAGAAFRW